MREGAAAATPATTFPEKPALQIAPQGHGLLTRCAVRRLPARGLGRALAGQDSGRPSAMQPADPPNSPAAGAGEQGKSRPSCCSEAVARGLLGRPTNPRLAPRGLIRQQLQSSSALGR